jgi:hypothetical protein
MKTKAQKKEKMVKSDEVRAREASQIRQKILELGFPQEDPDVARMLEALDQFAGDGVSQSGCIAVPAFSKAFVFKLSTQPHIVSEITIRHSK